MLSHFEHFLATVPLASTPPGFTGMTIRAVDFTETPLEEYDLRGYLTTPAEIINLAKEHHSTDVSYEVGARWDLWIRDKESASWKLQPERHGYFLLWPRLRWGRVCRIGSFHGRSWVRASCSRGMRGCSRAETGRVAEPQHPEEARFLMWMSQPQNLREYQEKTRENIQKLMGWMRAVEEALPVERFRLWSEGEENFEARLDEILAVR